MSVQSPLSQTQHSGGSGPSQPNVPTQDNVVNVARSSIKPHFKSGEVDPIFQETFTEHVEKAMSEQEVRGKVVKDGKFNGFVNGYVSGGTATEKIQQIKEASQAYANCGLKEISAQQIKDGISNVRQCAYFSNYYRPQIEGKTITITSSQRTTTKTLTPKEAVADHAMNYLYALQKAYPGVLDGNDIDALRTHVIENTLALAIEDAKPGEPNWGKVNTLILDNLTKICLQQGRDQVMITGSDHGVGHVVRGNIANTIGILGKTLENIPEVTPREKLMAMQVMVDHDLGYTTRSAQVNFGAAKDHPIASWSYVSENPNPFFDAGENEFIAEAVLQHSYPIDVNNPLDFSTGDTQRQSLMNVIAIVDAMGVTADTKLPSLFNLPKAKAALLEASHAQLRFDMAKKHLTGQPLKDAETACQTAQTNCKTALLTAISEDETLSPELKGRYTLAINADFSGFGATMIAPQFAGKITSATSEKVGGELSN